MYLHVRHLGISFLTSLYPVVSKNIAHAWSIVDQILSGENQPLGGGGHMPIVNVSPAPPLVDLISSFVKLTIISYYFPSLVTFPNF